jgi:putative ABC transport system ATP-binding protein
MSAFAALLSAAPLTLHEWVDAPGDSLTAAIGRPAAPAGAAVAIRKLDMAFPSGAGPVPVLHGIDLDLPAGELTMLVGPSGCGKTTLISIVAGTLTPTGGAVSIFGTPITALRDREKVAFRRAHIGFVFQQYNLLPALTAAENAAVPLVASGMRLAAAVREAAVVLERLGMAAHVDKLPRQLSGGQQQRVAIARALVHKPRLIVCDEPTAALDAESGRTVMELMRAVALERDRAVVVVTHDNRIFRFADRIVSMEDGRIVAVRQGGDAAASAH